MTTPPQNLTLDRKGRYLIGDKLGEGAQGAVYKIVNTKTGCEDEWAVKVTPHPKPTKNRKSENESKARSLSFERQLYYVAFIQHQGKIVPKVPEESGLLRGYGEDREGKCRLW